MSNVTKLKDQAQAGGEADAVLKHPLLKKAVADMQAQLFQLAKECAPDDDIGRAAFIADARLADGFLARLQIVANGGKLARADLDLLEDKKKRRFF